MKTAIGAIIIIILIGCIWQSIIEFLFPKNIVEFNEKQYCHKCNNEFELTENVKIYGGKGLDPFCTCPYCFEKIYVD